MFGYLQPFKDELRMKDHQLYKSVYCGLCKSMKKEYGILSSLTLNYDCTVLAMLYMSLRNEGCHVHIGRCTVNPLKKCMLCSTEGEALRFSGAVSVIMGYHKLMDTMKDSGIFKRTAAAFARLFLRHSYKKAVRAYEKIDALTAEMMDAQAAAEESDAGIDRCADPTAKLISKLCMGFSPHESSAHILEVFGFYVGRWIYIMDAADDLEKDIKHKSFNPFRKYYSGNIKETMAYCNEVLNMTASQIVLSYELLETGAYKAVLDNIIYYGLSYQQRKYTEERYLPKKKDKDYYTLLDDV